MQPYKKTLKIKNSCLMYAELLLRFNRSFSFVFQRESMAQRLFSPPPLPGLGTSKISLPSRSIQAELHLFKKKKNHVFFCKVAVSCWITSLITSSSAKRLSASESRWRIDSTWPRNSSQKCTYINREVRFHLHVWKIFKSAINYVSFR